MRKANEKLGHHGAFCDRRSWSCRMPACLFFLVIMLDEEALSAGLFVGRRKRMVCVPGIGVAIMVVWGMEQARRMRSLYMAHARLSVFGRRRRARRRRWTSRWCCHKEVAAHPTVTARDAL